MVVGLFNNASMKKTVFLTCEGFPDGLQSHNRSFTVSDHFISAGNLEEGRRSGCPRIANVQRYQYVVLIVLRDRTAIN